MSDPANALASWHAAWEADRAERAARHAKRYAEEHRRTAEAQDQINAARAEPTDAELDAQLSDAALQATPAVKEMGIANPGAEMYGKLRRELAAAFGVDGDTDWQSLLEKASAHAAMTSALPATRYEDFHRALKDPEAIIISGTTATSFRALQAAARAAQESARAAQVAGAALREAFQTFCAGVG